MKDKMTRHHLVPRSLWGINTFENILMLQEKTHQAFHKVFHNREPIEQFKHLIRLNKKVLSAEFHDEITRLLDFWEWQELKEWIKKKL